MEIFNEIEIIKSLPVPRVNLDEHRGSLWQEKDGGDVYILAQTAFDDYLMISLHSGNRWKDQPIENIEEITTEFNRVLSIQITHKES